MADGKTGAARLLWPCLVALLVAALAPPLMLSGHGIPNDVTIQAFVKPEGRRLHLLVRVPLRAMRDVNYPSRGAGQLDVARADEVLRDAATLWLSDGIALFEGDARLSHVPGFDVRASLPSDRSFATYEEALAHISGARLPDATQLAWSEGWLDARFEYPIQSDRAAFSVDTSFARLGLRTVTVLRFVPPEGAVRAFEYAGNAGLVRLDPRWHQAAMRFVGLGFAHILDGTDHLLFLFCLVLPFRRFRALVPVVTSFTAAHSLTLIASAYDMAPGALWFPPLIEALIALSIVYMALENIVAYTPRRRWVIAFAFGLVHGFGFSFALRETLQFAGSHLLTSLLSFNVGVELGQLLVIVLFIPAIECLFRFGVAERMGTIILSAFVAHTGWHWLLERGDRVRQFRFGRPDLTPALLAGATRWLMLMVLIAAGVWLIRVLRRMVRLRSA